MATIARLAVRISATTKEFVAALDKVGTKVKEIGSRVLKFVGISGLVSSALAGIGGAEFVQFIKNSGRAVVEQVRLARSLGSTNEGLAVVQRGLSATGQDVSAATAGFEALASKIGDAQTGGAAATDIFSRLGLRAEELAKIPVDQAFFQTAEAIGRLDSVEKKAAAAHQLFGSSAKSLLPLLSMGTAGTKQFAEEARKMGLSFSTVDGNKVEDAALAVSRLEDNVKGVGIQLAVGLAPFVTAAVAEFDKLGITGKGVSELIFKGMKYAATGVAFLIDIGRFLWNVLKMIGLGWTVVLQKATLGLSKLFEMGAKLPKEMGGEFFKQHAGTLKVFADGLKSEVDAEAKVIRNFFKSDPYTKQVGDFFDRIESKATTAATASKNLRSAMNGIDALNKRAALFEAGNQVFEQTKTPLIKFNEDMSKLNALAAAGAVTWDTYAKAAAKSVLELEAAHQLAEIRLPTLAKRDTAESYKAVIQHTAQQDLRRESPAERTNRILTESQRLESQQLDAMKKTAAALTNMKVVKI